MRVIRKLIYKLGFRPKPGSIFFSPSLAYLEASKNLWQAFSDNLCNCSIHDITTPGVAHADDCPMYD